MQVHIHNRILLVPVFGHLNSVHILTRYFIDSYTALTVLSVTGLG